MRQQHLLLSTLIVYRLFHAPVVVILLSFLPLNLSQDTDIQVELVDKHAVCRTADPIGWHAFCLVVEVQTLETHKPGKGSATTMLKSGP